MSDVLEPIKEITFKLHSINIRYFFYFIIIIVFLSSIWKIYSVVLVIKKNPNIKINQTILDDTLHYNTYMITNLAYVGGILFWTSDLKCCDLSLNISNT